MIRFLMSQIRHRRQRALALGAGILVAAVSFTLLLSATRTSELTVRQIVAESFRPAYDILVRPKDSFSQMETRRGLVRQNYLSGIYGGITQEQWERVKSLPGVEVAAPIANIGYIMPFQRIPITIDDYLNADAHQIYRVSAAWQAHEGLSEYPAPDHYIYYTRRDRFREGPNGLLQQALPNGERVAPCRGFLESRNQADEGWMFSHLSPGHLVCYSERSMGQGWQRLQADSTIRGKVGVNAEGFFPMLIAAIDPIEEAKLVDLDSTITHGRGLRATDDVRIAPIPSDPGQIVPVIASSRTYIDEELKIDIERLRIPTGVDPARRMDRSRDAYRWVTRLGADPVGSEGRSLGPIYDATLENYTQDPATWKTGRTTFAAYYVPSDIEYASAEEPLSPATVDNDPSTIFSGYLGSGWVPSQNSDQSFRSIEPHRMSLATTIHVLGRFDPELLPGFDELSEVPLETYYPPELRAADEDSERALGGMPLRPTQSIVDYIAQPPMLLTTIEAAKAFRNPRFFGGSFTPGPISVIRVRVKDVHGPDPVSRERIKNVAAAIARLGLGVDITAGSSPRTVEVSLPAGRYGRPALNLAEPWVEKGVAIRYLDAVDRKSLALFLLILVACFFFLVSAALSSVRARRTEVGTLMCLGWSRAKVFLAITGELAGVGLVAGALGSVLALGMITLFDLDMELYQSLLVTPVAVVVAVAAGTLPAAKALRGSPLDAVRPAVATLRRGGQVRGLPSLALNNLRRSPARAALAASGLVIGSGALTALITLNAQFQGTLVGTLLGSAISPQVRSVDLLSVALVIGLGALSAADMLYVSLKERAAEFAALSASGWSDAHLARVVALEASGLGLLGSSVGVALALSLLSLTRGIAIIPAAGVGLLVALGTTLVALLACVVPIVAVTRLAPAQLLAEEA
jgi:hypothetical protein